MHVMSLELRPSQSQPLTFPTSSSHKATASWLFFYNSNTNQHIKPKSLNTNMSNSIHIKEASYITPSEPTSAQILQLSALDSQLLLRFTIEYLLVYRSQPCLDRAATTCRIKSALARALVPYYPLAGRVKARADGSRLEVVCRAQGALFLEANAEQIGVSDFERAPGYVTQWRKLLTVQVDDTLKGAPPLVVQLTWLGDGGATLGVGFNHSLCDGIGSAEFLNSFAESALLGGGLGQSKSVSLPVSWDRHLMDPTPHKKTRANSLAHPEFNRVADLCGFVPRFSQERLSPTSVTFSESLLNELKSRVKSQTGINNFSSFEVLSAHVWRCWATSLNMPSNQIIKLLFSINIRNRVKPSLPKGYYGNAFVLGCAQTTVKEITEKGIGYVSNLVKRAKERVNHEYVREVVESVSLSGSAASPDSVGVLILSQWSRLGLEKVDFGMGRPVHVGPICCDRYCLMLPVYNQSNAVKVMVALPNSAVDQYLYLLKST